VRNILLFNRSHIDSAANLRRRGVGKCHARLYYERAARTCHRTLVSACYFLISAVLTLVSDIPDFLSTTLSYVFGDYEWNPDGSLYTNYNGHLIPSRIPLTVLLGGK
jgi:hypothetical protein